MKYKISIILLSWWTIASACSVDFFIASNGNDDNPGSIEQPFLSIKPVLSQIEHIQAQETVNVYLREGIYYLEEKWILLPQHSGSRNHPVTISSYSGEKVVISGGFRLDLEWNPGPKGVVQAEYPHEWPILDELYVNDKRYRKARYPNYDPQAKILGGTSGDAVSPERIRLWSNPVGGYLHALHSDLWGSKHYRIQGVNPDGTLNLQGGWQENRGGGFDPYYRSGYHAEYLFVENILEELDAHGEWFLDRERNRLSIIPESGDDLSSARLIGTRLHELIEFRGSAEHPVHNIHIKDLAFSHTSCVFMQPYERLLRGDWSIARLAALRLRGTEDCNIENCNFENLGGNALFLDAYNRRASVLANRFVHLGESAICVVGDVISVRSPAIGYDNTLLQDEIDLTPGPKEHKFSAECRIHNNLIHDIGIVGKQTAGVIISMAQDITVSHNTVYNCPRAAFCINDGCWGGHVLEYNDAFQTVRETGDHGPFNSWGRDRFWKTSYNGGRDIEPFAKQRARLDNVRTTHIRFNRFAHDGGHSWGIDLDDGSSNYRVYKNLCLGMGVKLREGFFRQVENNIIINGFGGFHIWLPGCDDVIARNIFVSDKPYQFIRANPEYAQEIDRNLFYNHGETPLILGVGDPMTLPQWQRKGFDRHSLLANPKFIDPDKGDYRVQEDSPARQLGFENFPMDRFGVYKPEFLDEIAEVPRTFSADLASRREEGPSEEEQHLWLGAAIKNLRGQDEISAAGMGQETGVLFLRVPDDSEAYKVGFKAGDVLIRWNNLHVHSVSDLLRYDEQQKDRPVTVVLFNATERSLPLR